MQTIHGRENTYAALNAVASAEEPLVNIEKSMFRTHIPRPLNSMAHLIIAGITLVAALIIAIFYAEHPVREDRSAQSAPDQNHRPGK